MSTPLDFHTVNAHALARLESLLFQWFPQGRVEGGEFKIGDLSGSPGRSLSVNIKTGVWRDFASDNGGSDPVSLLAAIRNCSMLEAARELGGNSVLPADRGTGRPAQKPAKSAEWTPLAYVPEGAPACGDNRHHRFGLPSRVWEYRDAESRLIGYVCRFDLSDGGKDVVPRSFCRNADGKLEWRWMAFGKPRPLYGLDMLAANPKAGVIIVEGEKAADAARSICPGVVVTWPGGSKAVKFADWSPLKGRKVLIWPDRDEAGRGAALAVAKALQDVAESVRVVGLPEGPDDGWDLADAVAEGWDKARLMAHLKADKERFEAEALPEPPPPTAEYEPDFAPDFSPPDDDQPFAILGHDDGRYYYLPASSRQVVVLSASGHTKLNLLTLAPMDWWERMFPGSTVNWDAAANSLIQKSHRRLFDFADIRGRGAWIDAGRAIYHAGDRLIVDGAEMAISALESEKVYPQGRRLHVADAEPARNREAARLLDLCGAFKWRTPLDGKFLAGWLMVAPICGALEWRPHVWLNGPSGTGKTWLISNVVSKILDKSALYVNASTTEPGIRQQLGNDALPVVFDEAESEDREDQQRMKRILILARQASREGEGKIVKGTAHGSSQAFHIRSAFFFSSIGVSAHQRADMSRITNLELMRRQAGSSEYAEAWESMLAIWRETASSPAWCASIRARSLQLATIIADNAKTFATAAVTHLGQQRDADQIGALLAGAYALTSTARITPEAAAAWCAQQDWSSFRPVEADADETRCLAHLLDANVICDLSDGAHTKSTRTTIGELIIMAAGDYARNDASQALQRMGVAVRGESLDVSNSHQELAKIFLDTPWARKWKDQLCRIDGARNIAGARFGTSLHRAVRVPLSAILEPDQMPREVPF